MDNNTKDTNPKDFLGVKKWRQFTTVPMSAVAAIGVAMLEGARKYGKHNYRVAGVRSSVYVDAAMGHLMQYWEGENIDPDSGLPHVVKAMASLAVLYDAMVNDMLTDDRPPKMQLDKFRQGMQKAVDSIFEKYPKSVKPYLQTGKEVEEPLERIAEAGKPATMYESELVEVPSMMDVPERVSFWTGPLNGKSRNSVTARMRYKSKWIWADGRTPHEFELDRDMDGSPMTCRYFYWK